MSLSVVSRKAGKVFFSVSINLTVLSFLTAQSRDDFLRFFRLDFSFLSEKKPD
jgi:hypothetical protein